MKHDLTKVPAKAPTCTEDGNIEYYECRDTACGCKELYSDPYGQHKITEIVKHATGHNPEKVTAKAATCTETGHIEHWKCSACGHLFSDSEGKVEIAVADTITNALGHDLEHHPAKAETYDDDGNEDYYECRRCGKLFTDSEGKNETSVAAITRPKKGAPKLGDEVDVDDFKYKVTNPSTNGSGTLTFTGVEDSTITTVSIPATVIIKGAIYKVTRVSSKALYNNKNVTTVVIGANVTVIDAYAFMGCSNLVKISGGSRLKTIGTKAFASCPKLKTFVISSKYLAKIGSYSFSGDKSLKTIYIKNTTKLSKKGVKKSLKGSKVKTVKVKKSKVKKYKKYFKKSNSGRKVKVKK